MREIASPERSVYLSRNRRSVKNANVRDERQKTPKTHPQKGHEPDKLRQALNKIFVPGDLEPAPALRAAAGYKITQLTSKDMTVARYRLWHKRTLCDRGSLAKALPAGYHRTK